VTGLTPHPITRFAPSPTGHLHLGHVVNAIYVWGMARARGGRVLLRLEDHDRQRSRPEFAASILEDLEWLRLEWDGLMVRQSDRSSLYRETLEALKRNGLVYACSCSRKDMAQTTADVPGKEMRYPGTCRSRKVEWQPGLSWRIALESEKVNFVDARLGPQVQVPADQCGDIQAMDRLGNWTYQFAVSVDDYLQQVSLVIRGEDLLPSTGRQIMLSRLLGREVPPVFYHHPLILKPNGEKLSKAAQDTGIRELRARGESPQQVLGRAAHAAGLVDTAREISLADLVAILRPA
jgi:glutamyl-tRNA synthetase/glutamyl-Q tRNA(Asp) synthetase